MSVVFGANLIDEIVLISDGRSTLGTGKVSDTATKIIPVMPLLAVAVTGNPLQAAQILAEFKKEIKKIEQQHEVLQLHGLTKETALNVVIKAGRKVSIQDSSCRLILAGIDPSKRQIITIGKVREYFDTKRGSEMLIPGQPGIALITHAFNNPNLEEKIGLPYPSTYLFSYSWPSEDIQEISCLDMACWGSGAALIEEHTRMSFSQLWPVNEDVPWFRKGILAAVLKDVIGNGANEGIGGLPQVVGVGIKKGVSFNGYSNAEFEMSYDSKSGSWLQVNKKTGDVVKTLPSLSDFPSFEPEEIINWVDLF